MLVLRDIGIAVHTQLEQFSLDHLARHIGQNVEYLEMPFPQREEERGHIQPVSHQDGDFIPPLGIDGRLATTNLGIVDDIVMHQRGRMNHFDDRTKPVADRTFESAHPRA